jgi:c-di-GMP-binding flagellar brake protein YcgR
MRPVESVKHEALVEAAMNETSLELGKVQSVRVLAQALRECASIVVEPRTFEEGSAFEAVLSEQSEGTICIRLKNTGALPAHLLPGAYCGCRLTLGQIQYAFETHVVEARTDEAGSVVGLARPESLAVFDRRRSPRASLARSCDVYIRWGPSLRPRVAAGKLLNLSLQGMACQVDQATAADMLIGDSIEAAMPGDADGEPIELPAILCNKTPGASEATYLLGLEFTQGGIPESTLERLVRHLAARQPSMATAE